MITAILIEGIDGSGKSTLAKELKNRLGWDLLSTGHKDAAQFPRFLQYYASAAQTVIERGHISETAYGRLFGRPDAFTAAQRKILDMVVTENMLVVLAEPPAELALQRIAEREHVLQVVTIELAAVERSRRIFRQTIEEASFGPTLIEYSSEGYEALEATIAAIMQRLEDDTDRA